MGEGLLDYKALELQKEGKSLEEVAQWVEENKLKICHFFMVEDSESSAERWTYLEDSSSDRNDGTDQADHLSG